VPSEAPPRRSGVDALAVVLAAVATVLEIDPSSLTASTTFAELRADSLVLVGVADEVESTIGPAAGLRIDDGALAAMTTLGELADYVARGTVS
jgi:acyl carrier protein